MRFALTYIMKYYEENVKKEYLCASKDDKFYNYVCIRNNTAPKIE